MIPDRWTARRSGASITTTGLDIAKSVFQVHGVDAAGQVVIRRELERMQGQARQYQQTSGRFLRSPFTTVALAVIHYAKIHGTKTGV